MPTSNSEAQNIAAIMNEYLDATSARELTEKLEREVGRHTENDSLKVSLEMLKALYSQKNKKYLPINFILLSLYLVVAIHIAVVFINAISFFVLPFKYPLYIWMPLNSFILTVSFARDVCPLTRLENKLRRSLNMPEIRGFIGHYIRNLKLIFTSPDPL
jgi:hypothetical protein